MPDSPLCINAYLNIGSASDGSTRQLQDYCNALHWVWCWLKTFQVFHIVKSVISCNYPGSGSFIHKQIFSKVQWKMYIKTIVILAADAWSTVALHMNA